MARKDAEQVEVEPAAGDPASAVEGAGVASIGLRGEDLPLDRKIYSLLGLCVAGGFLLGLVTERSGAWLWPVVAGALLAGGTGVVVVARRWMLHPVEGLLRGVELMRRVDRPLDASRWPTDRGDEFGRLAGALHELSILHHRQRSEAGLLRRTLDASVASATRHATSQLRQQASRDPLTDLGNRRFMDEHVPPLFTFARQSRQPIVCMAIDMDNFKQINDRMGHAVGDSVLRKLADLLRASVREQDVAVRLGGDEFVLWLSGMSMPRALELADSLGKLFRQQVSALGDVAAKAGLSIGIASTRHDHADSPDALLAVADDRLYDAKRQGKGRVRGVDVQSA